MRDVTLMPRALEDIDWWLGQDRKVLQRILKLLQETARNPFVGTGKPEPLKGNLSGAWSRRITAEHRMTYTVSDDRIRVFACRDHYTK